MDFKTRFITLLFLALIASVNSFSQKQKKMYCHARSGLSLRSTASLSGEKDTLIKYGEEVSLITKSDSAFRVNGLNGSWLKVKYAEKVGYVFSAYLNRFLIKVKDGKHVYLKDYAFDNLRQTDGSKNFEMTDEQQEWQEAIFGNIRYQCAPGGYCDLDERLYLEDIGVQDAMVMMTAYLMDYNDYKFKRSRFSYNKETKSYHYSYYKEREAKGFGQDYYMEYSLDKDGNYTYMSVNFDWDGGGGTVNVSKWSESIVSIQHTYSCH